MVAVGPGTDHPLLDPTTGQGVLNPNALTRADAARVVATDGPMREARLGAEHAPRVYTLNLATLDQPEFDAVVEAFKVTRGGAKATLWRHPFDDPPAGDDIGGEDLASDGAQLYRLGAVLDVTRTPGGNSGAASMTLEHVGGWPIGAGGSYDDTHPDGPGGGGGPPGCETVTHTFSVGGGGKSQIATDSVMTVTLRREVWGNSISQGAWVRRLSEERVIQLAFAGVSGVGDAETAEWKQDDADGVSYARHVAQFGWRVSIDADHVAAWTTYTIGSDDLEFVDLQAVFEAVEGGVTPTVLYADGDASAPSDAAEYCDPEAPQDPSLFLKVIDTALDPGCAGQPDVRLRGCEGFAGACVSAP